MNPKITEKKAIFLIGMDFHGYPYKNAGGWSEKNEIGQLWTRFMNFYNNKQNSIKHKVSEAGYEVWIGLEEDKGTNNEYIFVGTEVDRFEDIPLELVGKMLPETKYAVFTLKGKEIKSDWPDKVHGQWLSESGFKKSFDFIIEYYDHKRFKGMDDPNSELDIYVPIQ